MKNPFRKKTTFTEDETVFSTSGQLSGEFFRINFEVPQWKASVKRYSLRKVGVRRWNGKKTGLFASADELRNLSTSEEVLLRMKGLL